MNPTWSRVRLLSRGLACAFAVFLGCTTFAADDARRNFDVPSGEATATLKQLAQQAGQQVVFGVRDVRGIQTAPLKGAFTFREALERMIEGTGLVANFDEKTSTFAVRKEGSPEKNVPRAPTSRSPETNGDAEYAEKKVVLETFEVMGSKLLNMDIRRSEDDPQPYVVFNRDAIGRSGAVNLQDFLRQRLTMDANRFSNGQAGSAATGNSSYFNLRGIGFNQTLILIDGHRTATTAVLGMPLAVDLNGIPLSAVERIEVLPTTASAIYGGSATGGVINVVLRRDYAGAEVKLTYDNTFDTDSAIRTVELSAGFNLEGGKTSVLLVGSYSDTNVLALQDRDLFQRARAAILANTGGNYQALNGGTVPPLGSTTNIRSASGANLVLKTGAPLNSPITFVPVGYAGPATDNGAAFVANAGRYNLDLSNGAETVGGGRGAFLNTPRVTSFAATIRRQFSPKFQMFLDGSIARNEGRYYIGSAFAGTTIPRAATFNPFDQDIVVRVPVLDAHYSEQNNETRRVVAGAIASLPHDWKAEADFTWSDNEFASFAAPSFNTVAGVTGGSVNVLRDINAFPIDWSPLRFAGPFTTYLKPNRVETNLYTLRLAGPTFSLPGGPVVVSGLVERIEDKYDESLLNQISANGSLFVTAPSRSQEFTSAYVETVLPFFGEDNRRPGIESLKLQLGARWDDYTVNGATGTLTGIGAPSTATVARASTSNDSTNFTAAVSYQPTRSLALRASVGTGFLPPSANQVLSGSLTAPSSGANLFDPRRGNTSVGLFQSLSGGDPSIRPEESESWSAGVIFTPEAVPNLRLSLDYTNIRKTDNITQLIPQQMIDNEALFPGRVTRGPNLPTDQPGWAGPITIIDFRLVNLASGQVEAFDARADYRWETATMGTFEAFGIATWNTSFITRVTPALPEVENVGIGTFPLKFKGNAGVTWTLGQITAGWVGQYYDSYAVADARVASSAPFIQRQGNGGRVDAQQYHDLFFQYRFSDEAAGGWRRALASTEVTLGVRNIFDQEPPVDVNSSALHALYSTYGSPRLASYYVSVRRRF